MITNAIVNQPRLPFDWVQMNLKSMEKLICLQEDFIQMFWEDYFSNLTDTNHNPETQSWFPHDTFTPEEITKTVEKYCRRTQRLQSALQDETHKVFVIFFGFPQAGLQYFVDTLVNAIRRRCQSSFSFVVCNAYFEEKEDGFICYLHEQIGDKLDDKDWEDLTKRLEERIRLYLRCKEYEVIPFM